jgi:hypothetical protein
MATLTPIAARLHPSHIGSQEWPDQPLQLKPRLHSACRLGQKRHPAMLSMCCGQRPECGAVSLLVAAHDAGIKAHDRQKNEIKKLTQLNSQKT